MRKWKNPTGTRTYYAWRSMRSRCYNENNPSHKHYGGRGIDVCKAWIADFDQFVLDMGAVPEGKSLDRIDNNLGYSPDNCRWATIEQQLNNQRRNRVLQNKGETQTQAQWSRALGIAQDTLARRLKRMPIDRALTPGRLNAWRHGTRQGYEHHKCRCAQCKAAHALHHRNRRAAKKNKMEGIER